jgi:hypothetical protein
LTNSVSLFFDKLDVAIKGQTRCRVTLRGNPGLSYLSPSGYRTIRGHVF